MRASVVVLSLALAAAVLGGGCSLGDYDLARCDAPRLPTSLDDDPCAALPAGTDACVRWQCDGASGRCLLRTLDFDRDGEPALACGGHDCDDHDARRNSAAEEVCDGVDNDCNGIADEALVTAFGVHSLASLPDETDPSLGSRNGRDLLGAAVVNDTSGACILAFRGAGDALTPPCTFPAAAGVTPIAPVVRSITGVDVTFGAVFVNAPAACPDGQLAFRNAKGAALDLACVEGGASAPAFLPYGDGTTLAAAYLRRASGAPMDCPDAAPLDVVWIRGSAATSAGPAPAVAAQRLGLGSSLALRPPALVPLADGIILVAPSDGAVGAWLLPVPPGAATPTIVPLFLPGTLGELGQAREASAAVDVAGERLAIVAALGCPTARLALSLVGLAPGPVASVTTSVDVATTAAHDARVAWIDARKEWWVSWIDAGGLFVRRFDPAGAAQGDALNVSKRADILAATPDLDASSGLDVAYGFVTPHAIERASVGCP